jgi:hypothetical protein
MNLQYFRPYTRKKVEIGVYSILRPESEYDQKGPDLTGSGSATLALDI